MYRCTSSAASFDTATAWAMLFAAGLIERPQVLVAGAVARGVERGDDRRRVQQHRRLRRPGDERLVQVEHVELLVAERPHRAQRARRVGRERRHRAVGRGRQAVAERRDERGRRRAVARRQHPHLDAHLAELAGQAHHLGLHAAGHRQAVRADHRHPQQPRRPIAAASPPTSRFGHGPERYPTGCTVE